jgi:membrane-bound lytic murein transglycosylase F
MREILPLLAQKEHYTTLRYGYARGHEAVRYARRVRNYWDIMEAAARS